MNNSNNHYHSIIYKYTFPVLLLLFHGSLLADHNLKPFKAKYDVYRNDQHVANTYFNLQHKNNMWTWSMSTKPKGVFKWLTRKKPFTETRMYESAEGYRLSHIASGEYREKAATDNTFFDQKSGLIYYTNSKTLQTHQIRLPENLYSYHDIHLLYARMKESGETQMDIHFYKKGNVFKSSLKLETQVEIPYQSGTISVDRMTQVVKNSNKKMIYYYQDHSLVPLKIEQFKKNEPNTMMWRSSVENITHERTSSLPE